MLTKTSLVAISLVASLAMIGCGSDDASTDSPTPDAGQQDTGTQDTGAQDTGTQDTGTQDTGTQDTGTQDSGTQDTGTQDSGVTDASDGGGMDASDAGKPDASKYNVQLWVDSDATPKTFNDGFEGQTPSKFEMGISKFELLKTKTDTTPAVVFDYGAKYKTVDVLGTTEVGQADLATIPAGTYTYGRAKLDMVDFTIQTHLHPTMPPVPQDGPLNVLGALSDTTINGQARTKGWAQYTFTFFQNFTQQATLPELPNSAVGEIQGDAHATYLLMKFDQAMAVMNIPNAHFKATLTLDVGNSFRWQDETKAGYAAHKFDTKQSGTSEPVKNIGATGYHVKIEVVQ